MEQRLGNCRGGCAEVGLNEVVHSVSRSWSCAVHGFRWMPRPVSDAQWLINRGIGAAARRVRVTPPRTASCRRECA